MHFFETLKPNSQETAQNFEKSVLQKCLIITFYTYILVQSRGIDRWEADLDQEPGLAGSGSNLDLDPDSIQIRIQTQFLKLKLENNYLHLDWRKFGSKNAKGYRTFYLYNGRPDMETCLEPDRDLFKA